MKKYYQAVATIVKVIEVDDQDLIETGYEGEITEDMRREYLDDIVADEFHGLGLYDLEITETSPE